jgi:16S rRNA U1498 N3-methylase RsmE
MIHLSSDHYEQEKLARIRKVLGEAKKELDKLVKPKVMIVWNAEEGCEYIPNMRVYCAFLNKANQLITKN